MGSPYFDFNSIVFGRDESDPLGLNKFAEEERLRKEEEERKYKESLLGRIWEPTKTFFDASILQPLADAVRDPAIRETMRATAPGFEELEKGAGLVSGAGALAGMGMNWDMKNPEKFRSLPENWQDILKGEAEEGLPTAIEQVAPVDVATLGLGLAAKGATRLPKVVSALSKSANALDASEGVYGGILAGKGLAEGNLAEAGMGAFRMAMGGAGAASSLMPDVAPTRTSETPASETVDELPDLKLDEIYEPAQAAPRPEDSPLEFLLEDQPPKLSSTIKETVDNFISQNQGEIATTLGLNPELGGEGLRPIVTEVGPVKTAGGMEFLRSRDPNMPSLLRIDANKVRNLTSDELASGVLHEIGHSETQHGFGEVEVGERLAGRPREETGYVELGEAPSPDAYEIDATGELNIEDLPASPRGIVDPKMLPAEDISRHTQEASDYRAQRGEGTEHLFRTGEDALNLRLAAEKEGLSNEFQRLREEDYRRRAGEISSEEVADIAESGALDMPTETYARAQAAPGKAEQVEYNALSDYAKQQDAIVKEAGRKFSEAKSDAEKSLASQEFQKAKAERDRVTARIKQLEKTGVESRKPNVDELVEQAKRESAERKVEPAKNQAEVDKAHERLLEEIKEPTPKSENVVSTPANNLRKLLSATGMTRFNVHSLAKELQAKGLEVPEDLSRQLPELVKELKDLGWVNEKLGGTYTLLAAPGKDIAGIRGKGKNIEVSNIKEGLKESIEATKKAEVPVVETKPEPTPKVRPATEMVFPGEVQRQIKILEGQLRRAELHGNTSEAAQIRESIKARKAGLYEKPQAAPEKGKPPIEEEETISTEGLPEKRISLEDQMKAKLTPEEIKAIGNLFGTTKKKGTADIPEEVRLAQQAAIRARAKGEKVTEGPPSEAVAEPGEGPGRNYKVTLSDGSEHTVKATSPEEAKNNAEDILRENQSTKTVDKVEESLGSLEKAAKFEIDPEKVGREKAAEDIKDTKKAQSEEVKEFAGIVKETERLEKEQFRERKSIKSEEVKETAKLSKEEEKLRTAQRKEKFKRKPFLVNLSNGRVVTVNARNEAAARYTVEQAIKNKKAPIKIASIAEKPSALESAVTGYGKTIEESGFLQSPLVRTLNSMKSLAYGGDVGHMLRQGKQINADLLFSKHWREVPKQIPVVFKSATSQKFFDDFHQKLYSDPDIAMMVDNFNLDMPGLGKNLKEEAFYGGGLVEKAPLIGKFYARPSERAYTAGLNFLRAAEAKKLIESLKKRDLTPENAPEKYRAVAKAINVISQRGDFNPAYQKLFSDASAIYGAPRAKAARLQNAFELFKGGEAGDVVRTTAAKTLAFNASIFGLLAATTGATLVTDPEKSDFGKIRINDKISIDPWMGLGVTARTVAKLATGKSVSPYTGKGRTISPSEAVMQEFLGGIAPGIKLVWEALSGKDIRGYQVDRLKSLLNVTPMTAKSVAELLGAAEIEDALLLSLLQIGGEGVDVFDYEKARAEETKLKQERGLATQGSSKKKKRPKFPF